MKYGRITLSDPLMINSPYSPRNTPQPVCPLLSSHRNAGIQTTGAPIGSTESSPAINPSSNGRGTPEA